MVTGMMRGMPVWMAMGTKLAKEMLMLIRTVMGMPMGTRMPMVRGAWVGREMVPMMVMMMKMMRLMATRMTRYEPREMAI